LGLEKPADVPQAGACGKWHKARSVRGSYKNKIILSTPGEKVRIPRTYFPGLSFALV
jgi:hypothetical protein